MRKTIAIILFLALAMSNPITLSSGADWPMFRSDPSHSGVGTGSPVLTPTPLWSYSPNTSNDSFAVNNYFATGWSDPAVVDGVVYIGESGYYTELNGHRIDQVIWGGVYALNASSGTKLWDYVLNNDVESSPAVVDGVVYFGLLGFVQALNASNGAKLWNSSVGWVRSSPVVVAGVVYVGSIYDNGVYALNATNGAKLWNYHTNDIVLSSPAVVNGVVYIGCNDGNLYALNATDGNRLWNAPRVFGGGASSPVVVNGVVYSNGGNNVYALNATNGDRLWNYSADSGQSSPAVANGVLYMGFHGDGFYALNATNGDRLWNYTASSGYSSPAVVSGVVYFGSGDSLYALNANTGDRLWNYTGGGSSPVVSDGVVYYSSGSTVYALGEPYSITPPKISVLSPLRQTYNDSSISLVFTVDKPVNWTGYSLDGAENVSIAGNATLTWLSSGLHNVTVYAKDLFGNVGASETVVFTAKPFPLLLIAVGSVVAVIVVCTSLLIYFKRRRAKPASTNETASF